MLASTSGSACAITIMGRPLPDAWIPATPLSTPIQPPAVIIACMSSGYKPVQYLMKTHVSTIISQGLFEWEFYQNKLYFEPSKSPNWQLQSPYKNTPSPPSNACLIHSQNCAYKVGLEYLPKHRAITLHNTLAIRHSKVSFCLFGLKLLIFWKN
jgi:hypothetical protein